MNLKEHLRELEESHINQEVRQSTKKLDEILADEFKEIGSSGRMFGKEECLEGGLDTWKMSIHHYEINTLAEDIVLATYLIKDETRNRNTLRSSIWKYIDGRWQLYFHQGTISSL